MKSYSVTVDTNTDYEPPPFDRMAAPFWEDAEDYPPGTVREIWSVQGRGIHCEHGPALRIIDPSGVVRWEEWRLNHQFTRVVERNEDGKVFRDSHYDPPMGRGPKVPSERMR